MGIRAVKNVVYPVKFYERAAKVKVSG